MYYYYLSNAAKQFALKNLFFISLTVRCNGHLQGESSTAGEGSRTKGEAQAVDGAAPSDLFSELNLTEFQKLRQQLMLVGFMSHYSLHLN